MAMGQNPNSRLSSSEHPKPKMGGEFTNPNQNGIPLAWTHSQISPAPENSERQLGEERQRQSPLAAAGLSGRQKREPQRSERQLGKYTPKTGKCPE